VLVLAHRSPGFRDASHPRRSASSVPTLLTLPARVSRPEALCSSHRAAEEASHPHNMCPRFSRTLRTAEWANTTIAAGDTARFKGPVTRSWS
jgi:hypothetical protein